MKTLIIGAGLAGLGSGINLKESSSNFTILEASESPGGLTKSDLINNFWFDCTGHFIHTKTEEGKKDLLENGIAFDRIKRNSAIYHDNQVFPYPIQYNLRHIDATAKKKIVEELTSRDSTSNSFSSLHEFLEQSFGSTLFNIFHKPYNEKLWGNCLTEIPPHVIGRYLPKIDYELLLKGTVEPIDFTGYNNYFYYPKSGKIGSLADKLAHGIRENIHFNKKVVKVDPANKQVTDSEGVTWGYDFLLSSLPLDQLAKMLDYKNLEDGLYQSEIINLRIAFEGELPHQYHWMYIPEKTYPFHRIGFPKNINSKTSPNGHSSLSVEVNSKYVTTSYEELVSIVIDFLKVNRLINLKQVLFHSTKSISPAYTYVKPQQTESLNTFKDYLAENNICTIGRYGNWEYYSMEEAYLSGKRVAEKISQLSK